LTEATSGDLREVAADGVVVWEYDHSREIARALRYGRDYSGVAALVTATAAPAPDASAFSVSNAPNPFSASTVISYRMPHADAVDVVIRDVLGREVRRLSGAPSAAGSGTLVWDGRDTAGRPLPSGIYTFMIDAGDRAFGSRMLLRR
jgi:hypothetical protein